jgi:HSP20 family protein
MKLAIHNPLWRSPMEEILGRYFSETGGTAAKETGAFLPETDVREDEAAFTLELAVPGFPKDSFKVAVENRVLTLSGERKIDVATKEVRLHQVETRYGRFARSFRLPENVNTEAIEATYRDGILYVRIPKQEPTKLVTEISVN